MEKYCIDVPKSLFEEWKSAVRLHLTVSRAVSTMGAERDKADDIDNRVSHDLTDTTIIVLRLSPATLIAMAKVDWYVASVNRDIKAFNPPEPVYDPQSRADFVKGLIESKFFANAFEMIAPFCEITLTEG